MGDIDVVPFFYRVHSSSSKDKYWMVQVQLSSSNIITYCGIMSSKFKYKEYKQCPEYDNAYSPCPQFVG